MVAQSDEALPACQGPGRVASPVLATFLPIGGLLGASRRRRGQSPFTADRGDRCPGTVVRERVLVLRGADAEHLLTAGDERV